MAVMYVLFFSLSTFQRKSIHRFACAVVGKDEQHLPQIVRKNGIRIH